MKIIYGITKSNFGGAQRYVYDLAQEADRQGNEVIVLCGQRGILVEKLREKNIEVITLESLKRDISLINEIKSFLEIIKILKKEKPNVFHINSSKMGGLGALAGRIMNLYWKLTARNFKIKAIFTSHGWAFNEPRHVWQKIIIKFFTWVTILLAHKIICVSKKTLRDVIKWPFVKNKLIVIRNGISAFNLDKRKDDSFTVGTIAELHRIKGLDILLTAWSKFTKRYPAKLIIIGDGEEKENLINMARNLGISKSVVFRGFIDNARSLLSNFDIFCMPSRSEAMPYVLLEAGLAELPVIATSVGGMPEVIENGLNGILVPAENTDILFSSLILLAEDQDLRKRLGARLKSSILENFSFDKMAHNTLSLY